MKQSALASTLRTGDVVALDGEPNRYLELVCELRGLALVVPWPASIRMRGREHRYLVSTLSLVRGATEPEHARAVCHFAERARDFHDDERAELERLAGALGRREARHA